jgi:hypothetical protein
VGLYIASISGPDKQNPFLVLRQSIGKCDYGLGNVLRISNGLSLDERMLRGMKEAQQVRF